MGVANALNVTKKGLVLFDGTSLFFSGASNVGTMNLGISYSGGTFSITDAVGGALSSSNAGLVTLQNAVSPGQLISLTVTSPYAFTDAAGTNDIGANLFGITSGVAWGNDCPFYLYAIINSAQNDVAFGIGRVPHLTVAPAAGNLAIQGTTAASTQGSLFLMKKNGVNPTVANFASQPCVCIGSFRMRATLTPAWTVQALNITDGIGNFNDGTSFLFPLGQHGAATGTYLLNNGGTAPVFVTNTFIYYTQRSGLVNISVFMTGDGGTDGAVGVATQMALPYTLDTNAGSSFCPFCCIGTGTALSYAPLINANDNKVNQFQATSALGTILANSFFGNGARTIEGSFSYMIDKA